MAIKVNGTTVINDSRALNNITSVDSATATAIGNAGVGGGFWSLESTTNISANSTYISNIVLPSSGNMCMILLEDIYHGSSTTYYNDFFQLSTNGGSSYYTGSSDYARGDGTTRDYMIYRDSGQDVSSAWPYTVALLCTNLNSGKYFDMHHLFGKTHRRSGPSEYNYHTFEGINYYKANNYFLGTTDRPNRIRLGTNATGGGYDGGKVKVYSYSDA